MFTMHRFFQFIHLIWNLDTGRKTAKTLPSDSTFWYISFQCSYLPQLPCKRETETYFISSGALDEGDEYTCYYSTKASIKVILKKTSFILDAHIIFPVIFICCGVLMFCLVKFCGHRCGCPSWSQMRKLQQQQSSVQIQMQPLLVQRSR